MPEMFIWILRRRRAGLSVIAAIFDKHQRHGDYEQHFLGYEEYKGEIRAETRGSIISTETGISNNFGLVAAQGRGKLFISAGIPVYEGMVVGKNAKTGDIPVNVCKAKELTNFRGKNEGLLGATGSAAGSFP